MHNYAVVAHHPVGGIRPEIRVYMAEAREVVLVPDRVPQEVLWH